MNTDYTVIYNTCDKYESLWKGFFSLFKKYWPTYSNIIIINTEKKKYSFPGLRLIRPNKSGIGVSWSQRLINSLDTVTTPYVITILDDFWLKSLVNEKEIQKCVRRMNKDKSIKCYTFAWQPGPNKPDLLQKNYEVRGRFAKYRVNAQIALWRVDYLKKILRSYESPWQFELSGSFRSSIYGGRIMSLKKHAPLVFDYDFGFLIIRGKINKNVAKYFSDNEGIDMNLPFENYEENSKDIKTTPKILRMTNYLFDMIISLVRK